jgi:serine protease
LARIYSAHINFSAIRNTLRTMKLRRGSQATGLVAGFALLATVLSPIASPASATMLGAANASKAAAVGLIVTYKDGIDEVAPNGQPTGENYAGTDLTQSHDIGLNMTAVRFAQKLSNTDAADALEQIKRDPRVLTAQLDQQLNFSRASLRQPKSVVIKNAVKVASAVISPKAANYWSASSSRTPRVKLTWTPPKSLNGGKLVGYRVEMSANIKTWSTAVTVTTKSATITKGLSVGSVKYFRVRALTKVGRVTAVGLASVAVKTTPAVAPLAPKFDGPNVIFKGQSARWLPQTLSQRGGLSVAYQVTAISSGGDTRTCTTISQSCTPASMAENIPYTFKVVATNALASATSVTVSDPLYGSQWHLYSAFGIQAHNAWQVTKGKSSIVVAVLDSGITSHPDLNGQTVQGFDFISTSSSSQDNQALGLNTGDWDADPTDVGDYSANSDSSWHGTHVAGLIAAAQNTVGVSGVAPGVKILPIRVLGTSGGETSDLIAAINWASGLHVAGVPDNQNPARVMNLSIGTETISGCDSGTQAAFRSAWDRGVTAVTAAGNGDRFGNAMQAIYSYPGNCYPTINVGATGYSGDSAYYSNYGPGVDFSAPGGDDEDKPAPYTNGTDGLLLSTWNLGKTTVGAPDYSLEEGTSMASPVVAAVVALIYSVNPSFTSEDAYEIMKATVRPFKAGTQCAETAPEYAVDNGYSYCGAGIVDAAAAVQRALTTKPSPPKP